jgi:phosphomannomutase
MIHFFFREHQKLATQAGFLAYAVGQGVSGKNAESTCTLMENHLSQHRILDAERLLEILKNLKGEPDSEQAGVWLRLTGWKLQGTDGVRGIVSLETVEPLDALRLFIEENTITREFCTLYAAAWSWMLRELEDDPDATAVKELSELKVVIGEDGRDFYGDTGLKQSIIQGLTHSGISVVDLGVVPTPALAAYSLTHTMPGVMLTASHNPAEYNGIKLFLDGRKLYPEGFSGEYVLSWYILSLAAGEVPVWNDTVPFGSVFAVNREETDNQIFALLNDFCTSETLESVSSIPILLDTANGAYTRSALQFFSKHGIPVTPVGCEPGENRINANCGVGVLESLGNVLVENETHPEIIQALFSAGRSSKGEKAFGIVLDGDGDRGFLLMYSSDEDTVYLYDGDSLGYMAAARIIRNCPAGQKSRALFVSTVESDTALLTAVRDDLTVQTATVCVGDRWLVHESSLQEPLLIGCERSGHVIIPTVLDREKDGHSDKVLLTGNGLAAALTALSYLLEYTDKRKFPGYPAFAPGYRAQIAVRNGGLESFYRDSELWFKVSEAVTREITLNCRESSFSHEPDMLYFDLLDTEAISVGRWYMRKSGTEPKILFCISVLAPYSGRGSAWMTGLEQKIAPMLMQFT